MQTFPCKYCICIIYMCIHNMYMYIMRHICKGTLNFKVKFLCHSVLNLATLEVSLPLWVVSMQKWVSRPRNVFWHWVLFWACGYFNIHSKNVIVNHCILYLTYSIVEQTYTPAECVSQAIDINEPIGNLKKLLEPRLQCSLDAHEICLQDIQVTSFYYLFFKHLSLC